MVLFGTASSLTGAAINHIGASLDLFIADSGRAWSDSSTAVAASFTTDVSVANNGTIQSDWGHGLYLHTSGSSGTIDIINTGIITGSFAGIITAPGTGTMRITNHGDIVGTGTAAIFHRGGDAHLVNYGDIRGANYGYDGAARTDIVTNFRTIEGGIFTKEGDDMLYGSRGNDLLRGHSGDDNLFGGNGDDVLVGGPGKDKLTGGLGSDLFVFKDQTHSPDSSDANTIADFEFGVDHIDLSDLIAGDFGFVGSSFFSGTGPEVRATFNGSDTIVSVDVDGDKVVDMKIILTDVSGIQAGDFIL